MCCHRGIVHVHVLSIEVLYMCCHRGIVHVHVLSIEVLYMYHNVLLSFSGSIFTLFSNWVKIKDESTEKDRREKFTEGLRKMDTFLSKTTSAFLCSDQWSIADCVLVPRLYHIFVVATNKMDYHEFDKMPNLKGYMEHAFSSDIFKATDYPIEYILHGWAKYTD